MTAPRDLEEIVSAIVDGELDADELERAVADPEVAQRVEEVTAARTLLRDLPPPPDLGRANAVAAALDAAAPASPPRMPAHATPPGRRTGGLPRWLAPVAACLVVLALVAGVALVQSGNGDNTETAASDQADEDSASTAGDAGASAEEFETDASDQEAPATPEAGAAPDASAGDDGAVGEAAPDEQDGATGGADRGPAEESLDAAEDAPGVDADGAWIDLGAVADEDDLEARVIAELRGAGGGRPVDRGTDPSCAAGRPGGDADRGQSELSAVATLDGTPVWVQVYPLNDGSARMVATDPGCDDLVDRIIFP